jgi:undecaprenyl-diphosphatase
MIETLNTIDTHIFLFLNGINSPFFDEFMMLFTGKTIWIPFYSSLLYLFIRFWKKDAIWIVLGVVLCILIADQIASGLLKPLIERPRPSRAEELEGLVHLLRGYRGGRYGFVSSHAANSVALAIYCSLLFRNNIHAWAIGIWAAVVSYSRICLGVHYPGDIIGGAIVGTFAALFCVFLLKKIRPAIFAVKPNFQSPPQDSFLRKQEKFLPIWVLVFSVLGFVVYSFIFINYSLLLNCLVSCLIAFSMLCSG